VRRGPHPSEGGALSAVWLYAICRCTGHAPSFSGPAGEHLRLVEAAGLAAVVGKAIARGASLPALKRYDALQRALARQCDAMLPARFGTHIQDETEAAFILEARAASLRLALRRVRGCSQMTLRTVCGTDPLPPAASRASSGASYLRARASAAQRDRAMACFEPVAAAVGRWVSAERFERRGAVASLFQLVPVDATEAYAAAARQAAEEARVSVLVTGPYPAYAFAP
jgi:gas vesicle protein GvpL/GvpF